MDGTGRGEGDGKPIGAAGGGRGGDRQILGDARACSRERLLHEAAVVEPADMDMAEAAEQVDFGRVRPVPRADAHLLESDDALAAVAKGNVGIGGATVANVDVADIDAVIAERGEDAGAVGVVANGAEIGSGEAETGKMNADIDGVTADGRLPEREIAVDAVVADGGDRNVGHVVSMRRAGSSGAW